MKPNKKCYRKVQSKIYSNGDVDLLNINESSYFLMTYLKICTLQRCLGGLLYGYIHDLKLSHMNI